MRMEINRQRLIELFLRMLEINSTSRHETAMADLVIAFLLQVGADISYDNAAILLDGECNNIIGTLPGNSALSPIMFCAHIDTVAPTAGIKIVHQNGKICSGGDTILGADDKAGVAAIMEMVFALQENNANHPQLELVFTVAEEIGVMGSMVLDYSLLKSKIAFVPDSTGPVGTIITSAPAQKHLDITITGKAAHAGMSPEAGVSAIAVAAEAISSMKLGRIDSETTANIGTIHGGTATNIIAEKVTIEGEARSRNPEKLALQLQHMIEKFQQAAAANGAEVVVEISEVYPSFNIPAHSQAAAMASCALEPLGIPAVIGATGGGSDANFFNHNGIETVILSAGYLKAHCHDEMIEEDELVLLAQWLYNIAVQQSSKG